MSELRIILRSVVVGFLLILFAGQALAQEKTLIKMVDGKPAPALAKSWKPIATGKYQFDLDPAQKLEKGKALTPQIVKATLEKKMKNEYGVKVAPKGKLSLTIEYKGDEKAFLQRLSEIKIKEQKEVEIALESSVSEGSIRAKASDRDPVAGEVKGTIVSMEAGKFMELRVVAIGGDGLPQTIKVGQKLKVNAGDASSFKKGDVVFAKPTKEVSGIWESEKISKE